jgi:hypothetical protein
MKDIKEKMGTEAEAKFYSLSKRRKGPDTRRSSVPE